jgi:PIN domain
MRVPISVCTRMNRLIPFQFVNLAQPPIGCFGTVPSRVLSLTSVVCERAARIRVAAGLKLKVPDCLHLAAAIEHGCGLFLTNDAQLLLCSDIPVEVLT